jgi:hypothetical protein
MFITTNPKLSLEVSDAPPSQVNELELYKGALSAPFVFAAKINVGVIVRIKAAMIMKIIAFFISYLPSF